MKEENEFIETDQSAISELDDVAAEEFEGQNDIGPFILPPFNMQDHQDQEFLGVISGVTEWGIYVEIITNKCEGMVRTQDMRDDHYIFDKDEFAVIGQRTKTVYQLGDEVYVKVKNADLVKKHLDFIMLGHKNEYSPKRKS